MITHTCKNIFYLSGVDGRILSIVFYRYGPPQQTRYRLIVENLSSRCSWQVRKLDVLRARRFRYRFPEMKWW